MRVKRYVVDSMPDAMSKIRSELGVDAVILNTKEIRSGGFLGMFGKKKIEVIAAVDSNNEKLTEKPIKRSAPISKSQTDHPFAAAMIAAGINRKQESAAVAVLEEKPVEATKAPEAKTPSNEALMEEIRQMKEMVYKLTVYPKQEPSPLPPAFQKWEQKLQDHDFDPSLIDGIIQKAMAAADAEEPQQLTDERTKELIHNELRSILAFSGEKGIETDSAVLHFVGPTGVGKTTTIAKLAAEQALKLNRKVGFITSDTYRIAAVEQLKIYANILNAPLEVVFSPLEMTKAFEKLSDCDIIFMDTAGRNYRNEMYVSELNSLLQSRGKSETYLVLSLTTKYKDMKAITSNFSKFRLDKVLFTKMDETQTYGPIFNLKHDFPLQLSYVANGQNVPDDIMLIDEDGIIERILGETSDE